MLIYLNNLQGEFLLSGPGGLGVFVLSQGFSDKPPINFSSQVSALAFHHPYIIAVCRQGICFYRYSNTFLKSFQIWRTELYL